jgi:hypothetical protein
VNDDDLFHLDETLASASEEAAPRRPTIRRRVVLLPDLPALDADAELNRVMPRILSDVVDRVNVALDEILPATGARFIVLGRRVRFVAETPEGLDLLPEVIAVELNREFTDLVPMAEFHGAHLGSLCAGLQRYADELADAYTERERKKLLARDVEARRQGPLQRLKEDDRKLVESAAGELPIIGPAHIDAVDELWAAIHADAPWLQAASVEAWRAMRHEVGEGRGAWCPPILLNGEPGTGKTTLGRSLAVTLGVPLVEIDAGNGTAAFQIAGLEKGWNGAEPGLLVETILRKRIANPVVIVNELCRAGSGMTAAKGGHTSLSDALLALLDRGSCRRWRCPALRVDFDLSRVTWILTSNRLDTIDPALLSRVRTVEVPKPSAAHVTAIVRRKLADLDEEIADRAADMIAEAWTAKSLTLRQVDAMCQRVRRSLTGPRLH